MPKESVGPADEDREDVQGSAGAAGNLPRRGLCGPGNDPAALRARIYRWLASAFLPPDPTRFARLLDEAVAIEDGGADRYPCFVALRAAVEAVRRGSADYSRTAELHTTLFSLPAGKAVCPPLGCDYLNEATGSFVEQLAELDGFYRRIGIEPRSYIRERPDHLTVELEALAVLALVEASATGDGQAEVAQSARQAAEHFLRLHLMRWFPRFRERVKAGDPVGHYACLADAVHAFIVHDHSTLRLMQDQDAGSAK